MNEITFEFACRDDCFELLVPSDLRKLVSERDALRGKLKEYEEKICNCRWDGETQVQQCTLHEAHVDAIHEWAERAKVAEQRLAEAEVKLTETEKALRLACNTYIVDDYYTGDLRNERLERAVRCAMKKPT